MSIFKDTQDRGTLKYMFENSMIIWFHSFGVLFDLHTYILYRGHNNWMWIWMALIWKKHNWFYIHDNIQYIVVTINISSWNNILCLPCPILKSIQSNQGGSNFVLSQSKTNRFCVYSRYTMKIKKKTTFFMVNLFANPKHTSHGN